MFENIGDDILTGAMKAEIIDIFLDYRNEVKEK